MSQVTIRIPTPLRKFTAGTDEVSVEGHSIDEVLKALGEAHQDLLGQILDNNSQVRSFVNIFLNEDNIRNLQGLETPIADKAVISIVPAVAGGHS